MELKENTKQLQSDIYAIRSKLSSVIAEPIFISPNIVSTTDQTQESAQFTVDQTILKQKCKLLKAQCEVLSNKDFIILPRDASVECIALYEDYRRRIGQMKECWSFLKSQRSNLNQEIEREKKLRIELEALVQAAECKLQDTEQMTKKDVYKRLQAKCNKLEKINKEKAVQMSQVLDKEYPLPDAESFAKVKKKMESVASFKDMRLDNLHPLKDIVKSLIASCLETPNDPYIVTDHRHWPPYIELLLECDIALRHPADCTRIKLFPFYL